MDMVDGLEMGLSLSLPSTTRISVLSLRDQKPAPWFFPTREGLMLHLSSSEEVDVVGIDQDETEDSLP